MNTLHLLLIEDDEIEQMKFQRIVSKFNINHKVSLANNGEEALQLISDKKCIPDLILLDLNMPKMNGLDFLKQFKEHKSLTYIPIIILTTSNNHQEIKKCYSEGASGYLIKPLKYEAYTAKINALISYWEHNEIIKV